MPKAVQMRKWFILGAAYFLGAATLFGVRHIDRFYPASSQMLVDPMFSHGLRHWGKRGDGHVSFTFDQLVLVHDRYLNTVVSQNIKIATPGFYKLTVEGKVEGVSAGPRYADRATVTLVHRDKLNQFISNETAMRLDGTSQSKEYSINLYLSQRVNSVDISVRLLRSIGTVKVQNLQFVKLNKNRAYTTFFWVMTFAWMYVLFLVSYCLYRSLSFRMLAITSSLFSVVYLLTLVPGKYVSTISRALFFYTPESLVFSLNSLLALFYDIERFSGTSSEFSKFGHIVIFFLIGLIFGVGKKQFGAIFGVLGISCIAFTTEVLQNLTMQRTGSIPDFYVDIISGIVGLVIGAILVVFISRIATDK